VKRLSLLMLALLVGCKSAPATAPSDSDDLLPGGLPKKAGPSLPTRPFAATAPLHTIVQKVENKPIVSFRLVFRTGSIDDPKGKEGLTALTTALMAEGGTKELSSSQLIETLFPWAAQIHSGTDKELTVFSGRVHVDKLQPFWKILGDLLLEPRFDQRELDRLRADALNSIRDGLRGNNDEELGKVALDAVLYAGHPYAHHVDGTVAGLSAITLDDVKAHWKKVFTQDRLIIGLAGAVDEKLEADVKARLGQLPATGAPAVKLPPVSLASGKAVILQKDTLSTAVSMGYPFALRRGDPDFYLVAFALSYLGEHRQQHGLLFKELREKRGLNYGDYAYVEHFHQEGWDAIPRVNVARSQQDFTIWIRPVEPQNGLFATRGAVYFLDQLRAKPVPTEDFETMRGFLSGLTRLWEQTDQRRLGYAIDGLLYGTPAFLEDYRQALAKLTPETVHAAVSRHLSPQRLSFAFVAKDAAGLAGALKSQAASPITYSSPKPEELLTADKAISAYPLPVRADAVKTLDAQSFMER
jgi:zinc protease